MKKTLLILFIFIGTSNLVNAQAKKFASLINKPNQQAPIFKNEAEKAEYIKKNKLPNTTPLTDAEVAAIEANKKKSIKNK